MREPVYRAVWEGPDDSGDRVVTGVDDLAALVRQISTDGGSPVMLLVWDVETGRELGVGLGREQTVFTYQGSVDPPYYITDGDRGKEGVVSFAYGGEQTEYLRRNLVDKTLILPTIQRFLSSEGLPDTVDWERL